MKTEEFSVNTGAILREVARHFSSMAPSDAPGMVMACNEIRIGLVRIANRAAAIQDIPILEELVRLGIVHRAHDADAPVPDAAAEPKRSE